MNQLTTNTKVVLSKIGSIAKVYFITYIIVCVIYATAVLIGYTKGVQIVVKETQYVKQVEAVSPLGE